MDLTQIITRVYKDSLTLRYPPTIDIWVVLQFWYPHVDSLIPSLMVIIGTMNSSILRSNIGMNALDCSDLLKDEVSLIRSLFFSLYPASQQIPCLPSTAECHPSSPSPHHLWRWYLYFLWAGILFARVQNIVRVQKIDLSQVKWHQCQL